MRKIATSFAGHLGTPTTKRQELRLLRQPIYRFPDAPAADGAVFAFVEATDPEVLFLVRANMQAQQPTWEFAAARMTIVHAGGTIFLLFHLKEKPLPIPLIVGHGAAAITAFIVLLIAIFY